MRSNQARHTQVSGWDENEALLNYTEDLPTRDLTANAFHQTPGRSQASSLAFPCKDYLSAESLMLGKLQGYSRSIQGRSGR